MFSALADRRFDFREYFEDKEFNGIASAQFSKSVNL
jgi:hypothetical protein